MITGTPTETTEERPRCLPGRERVPVEEEIETAVPHPLRTLQRVGSGKSLARFKGNP
jgi:hypothetical protein